jgi:hypothetical protein
MYYFISFKICTPIKRKAASIDLISDFFACKACAVYAAKALYWQIARWLPLPKIIWTDASHFHLLKN